ncbi:T9SS type A sorting domain-containing protein [Phaeocystidibacter luteus]|uniref:T9SS type A sorting domain-containing protein n=1 Tax=Phaeocystidibacter luteus TaxID=911197 RepID=A0A6N6RCU8_9FLAO|nr:T9SS type A sorting domain-containing protein [Phaeocystidibacter luteus]KAB2805408.1 T9SS type A sorting domain-containing protein [Phaeocystidibacter luteus]
MKKLYTLMAVAGLASSAFAQQITTARVFEGGPALNLQSEVITDSLISAPNCAQPNIVTFGAVAGGYFSGTNGTGDKEKGLFIFPTQGYNIENVYALIPVKEHVISGDFQAYIYPFDTAAGSVGAAIGTSSPVSITSIDTANLGFTAFNFPNRPYVSGPFIMTVQVDNGGDTIAIATSDVQGGCGNGSMVEKLADDSWANTPTRWNANVWLWMFADADGSLSTDSHILDRESAKAFPNPAANEITITYDVNAAADVTLNIIDVTGRVVYTEVSNNVSGRQFQNINTSEFNNGVYFYTVSSENNVLEGKFVVRH